MLFRRSEDAEARVLTATGLCVTAIIVASAAVVGAAKPFSEGPIGQIQVAIETPYVGQGVSSGTALVIHGVKVGEVEGVSSLPAGGVRLNADLDKRPTDGLTDAVDVDFRPANYFGVTAINLIPRTGGSTLADGSVIRVTPQGNFTMQALLSQLGDVSHGVLTPRLVSVIDRISRYTDALDPMLETILIAAKTVTDVQSVSTAQLLTNSAGISVATPGFADAAIRSTDLLLHTGFETLSDAAYEQTFRPSVDLVSTSLFGASGKLLSSHSAELASTMDMIKALTDVIPGIVPPDALSDTARELRGRLERLFAGAPDQRAVQVQVVLDYLPGVAAPMGLGG